MPWSVKKSDNKFCVVKEGEESPIEGGCHGSRDEALDHMKALYANEAAAAVALVELCMDMDHGEYKPKPGLPAEHAGMMALIAKNLKHTAKEIFEAHYEEEKPMPVSAPSPARMHEPVVYQEYTEEELDMLAAAGNKEVEEFAWEGPIAFEGVLTGDNRVFKAGAIQWDEDAFPMPFRWQRSSVGGHQGAVPIGRVDRMERKEDGSIYASGVVIPSLNDEAAEYLRLLESGVASGVSVDGDSAVFDVQELADGKQRIEFSSMRVRSLTAVDIPAFSEAQVDLTPDEEDTEELAKKRKKAMKWAYSLTAAACAPVKPPVEWYEEPQFTEPTPITVTSDGRVFGHLALFDTCHIGFPGSCVSPPRNGTYKYFHTGEIETQTGECVEVGHLTFNTGHAAMTANAKAAAAHYDHTGLVAADVRVGEDEHGIWVTGALRSHLSDEDVRAFRAAPLSGDWRRIAGKLELVGALAVNVPGFPVPRTRSLVASGETETLFVFQEAELNASSVRKQELAKKIHMFQDEAEEDVDIPETEEAAKAQAKKMGPQEIAKNLQLVKDLLEDPDEEIEDRDGLAAYYKEMVGKFAEKYSAEAAGFVEEFHLVGQHDQADHNKGGGGGGGASKGGAPKAGAQRAAQPSKTEKPKKFGGSKPLSKKRDYEKYQKPAKNLAEAKAKQKRIRRSRQRWGAVTAIGALGFVLGGNPITAAVWVGSGIIMGRKRGQQAEATRKEVAKFEKEGKTAAASVVDPMQFTASKVALAEIVAELTTAREQAAKKSFLAARVFAFADEDPSTITEADAKKMAKNLTKAETQKHLVGLKAILDDPDELLLVSEGDQKKLKELYDKVSNYVATEEFHLLGQHDQSSHSHGGGGGSGGGGSLAAKARESKVDKGPSDFVIKGGKPTDPLNQYSKTAKEAHGKYLKAANSANNWGAVAVLATGAAFSLGLGSAFLMPVAAGLAAGAVINAGVRVTQAKRHRDQRDDLLKKEGKKMVKGPYGTPRFVDAAADGAIELSESDDFLAQAV